VDDKFLVEFDDIPVTFLRDEENYKRFPMTIRKCICNAENFGLGWELVLKRLISFNFGEDIINFIIRTKDICYSFEENFLYRYAIKTNNNALKEYLYPYVKEDINPYLCK